MPINLIAARRLAYWTKVYAGDLISVRQTTIRKNDVRLNDDLKKWRSAEQRFEKMSFGIMKFR